MKILVDGFGSDKGVGEIKKGCLNALEKNKNLYIGFIAPSGTKSPNDRMEIIETDEFIDNNEDPARAIRRKKNASIVIGARLMNEDKYEGLLSAGSTGGMLAAGLLISKRLDGVQRAALTIAIPTDPHPTILLDAGANMDCDGKLLSQFATMGSIYAKNLLNLDNPRIALLNVGPEEAKGNQMTKEAYKILKNSKLNFIGNIEARDIFSLKTDVIVCDGFSGNIALKTLEATASYMSNILKDELMKSIRRKIGAIVAKPAFDGLKSKMDYSSIGAQPLLGIKKPIFKAHGSSDFIAIESGIEQLINFIEKETIINMSEALWELK